MNYTICADISGTHTRLFIVNNSTYQYFSIHHYDTKKISSISNCLNEIINYYSINVVNCVLAGAGPVRDNTIKLVNANVTINGEEIQKNTSIKNVYIINDFEAMAYGIDKVPYDKKKKITHKQIGRQLIIGAGTGLGIATFENGKYQNKEAGHNNIEWGEINQNDIVDISQLKAFLQNYYNKTSIEWEDLVSGRGLEVIHYYVSGLKEKASLIGNKNRVDVIDTFNVFYFLYSQAINHFSKHYSCSQVYVVGGIIEKTHEFITKNNFINYLDSQIGITLILDYDVSIYGLVEYCRKYL